jgi:hypothetical protein
MEFERVRVTIFLLVPGTWEQEEEECAQMDSPAGDRDVYGEFKFGEGR